MGEKASIFQGIQIGVESISGTAVAANKKLLAASIIPNPKVEADAFKARGNKYSSFVTLNKEWAEAKIEGKLTYNEIVYLLSSLLSMPTPVQQASTTAYKWTFVSNTSAEDAGETFTVEQGDENSAWRVAGLRVSGLEFTFNRNEVSVSGTAIGKALETGVTLTASPTSLTPKPVLPGHLKFYLADTQAGLATAEALTRGFSLSWGLTDKIGNAWPVGQDPVTVEKEPSTSVKLKLATDTAGMALIATMRAGSTQWIRIKGEGATIASTYKYTFQLDLAAQIKDVSEFSDEDGLYLVEYGLEMVHDATWGKSFQLDVTTDVQTL
jgi:hypothetical protein